MTTAQHRKKSSPANSSRAVDAQLSRYRAMRNFDVTEEPRGGSLKGLKKTAKEKKTQLPFVIQKHAATRLHYDFRLGWRGVLKSWAVTKGPSYFPGDKRLAVQVEDHPMEYGGFEGIIPKGQYGGGTVMVWDQGTWEPHGDVDEGLAKGNLKFALRGKKLIGDWALIRMGGKAAEEKKPNWLLIKEHDGKERGANDPPITEEEPDSVVTGGDLDAIAKNQDHVWSSGDGLQPIEEKNPVSVRKSATSSMENKTHSLRDRPKENPPVFSAKSELRGVPREVLPKFVQPQLALQVSEAPEGQDWIHELKLDGYRILGRVARQRAGRTQSVTLLTRSGLDWTHRMPEVANALAALPVEAALLDGEVVVFDEEGKTNFAKLQAAFQEGKQQPLTYVIFDLLHLNGHTLRGLPLDRRKEILEQLLARTPNLDYDSGVLRYSEHLGSNGREIFKKACQLGAEGIVSKKKSSLYSSSRSGSWLKIKCIRQQEFVIGGFTLPSKSGVGIGALLLGYYRDGKLVYAGRTGTGFTQKGRQTMRAMLEKVRQPRTPFMDVPSATARDAQWVQPRLVCEVQFATWTADNLVRQASFKGLREDKPAGEVKREISNEIKEDLLNTGDAPRQPRQSLRKDARKATRRGSASKTATRMAAQKRRSSAVQDDPFPIPLTHPDKQVDSESKLTKRELAEYFWAVREQMLPHISNRPLSIVRCPQGSTKPCFYQKRVIGNLPEGIDGIDVRGRKSGELETYLTLSSPLGLAGLAQLGVLEIHPWGSTNRDIEKPDRLIFDLDP
ncbi:MAG: DNA ligase D, partial [Acidobacteriaceae bacterium]